MIMEHIKNNYQLSKTLRFGLTQKQKNVKTNSFIHQSHSCLKELTHISEQRIKANVNQEQTSEMQLSIKSIRKCMVMIEHFIKDWREVYYRSDQIALDKDFYKKMSKKIGFEAFWMEKNKRNGTNTKKPQSRIIALSELFKRDDLGKERQEYIVEYWENNLLKSTERYDEVNEKLEQFELALKINRTDNRPNEVELRKMFLSLVNMVREVVEPLCLGQISFPKLDKLADNSKNEQLRNFATDYQSKSDLLTQISELKKYFEENGGNVPYCRATLNPLTAVKNPKSTDNSILDEIKKLKLDVILRDYQSVALFDNSIRDLTASQKMQLLNQNNEGLIKRGLLFKYKPIPAIVQYEIAKVLSAELNKDEQELRNFLRDIGQVKSPAKDYAELQDKKDFDINHYPLKVAFDFAWESLAKSVYHPDIDFPEEQCKTLLREVFQVDENNENFKFYATLLELRSLLATLEHGKPTDIITIENKVKEILKEIDGCKFGDKGTNYKSAIENWIHNRNKKDFESKNFKTAKQQIGLVRGRQKNLIKKYDEITKSYKDIAMKMGKTFAEMRDKITGASELNKVSHYAMIVEDTNQDRYVLLQEFAENKKDRMYAKSTPQNGDFKAYSVNSVTSSAIAKMIRKIRIDKLQANERNNNRQQAPELSETQKEARNIKEWKDFIAEKRWNYEFDLKLDNKNFEQIKKEIDSKCFKLETKYMSEEVLVDLVKNQNCLLLPIINQDLAKKIKSESNQFTKDWNAIFAQNTPWRLTPEFRVSYRKPTPNYPKSERGDKRYSRFQMIGHFLCDFIPKTADYISNREMIANFKDDEKQKQTIINFHERLNPKSENEKMNMLLAKFGNKNSNQSKETKKEEKFYVFGIDRGQKELATLCVIDQDKKIIGDFNIYTRSFNTQNKQWEHQLLDKRHILDLSNLRVETTIVIDGKPDVRKVLVDLSEVKVKDKNGNYTKTDKMQVKMQQLAYIRKLQFQMQTNPDTVLEWYNKNQTKEAILNNFVDKPNGEKGLVSFYGSAVEELKDTLPIERIEKMLQQFKSLKNEEKEGKNVKAEIDKLIQLEPVDNLKAGVVANMVGVIAHLLKEFNYQVYISLEDLSNPFGSHVIDGTTGTHSKTNKGEGKRADVEKYAGLGLYNFFEMQLLKKLFRIQQDSQNILHLVPAFRAVKNYENIIAGKDKIKNQFGIVFFVDANSTSKMCPVCNSTNSTNEKPNREKYPNAKKGTSKDGKKVWVERDKSNGNDNIKCYVCGFDTTKEYEENPLKFIKSGDDNAAYIISAFGIKAYELATSVIDSK